MTRVLNETNAIFSRSFKERISQYFSSYDVYRDEASLLSPVALSSLDSAPYLTTKATKGLSRSHTAAFTTTIHLTPVTRLNRLINTTPTAPI